MSFEFNTIILGEIYDPDTDCYYILMRARADDYDQWKRDNHIDQLPSVDIDIKFGSSARYKKKDDDD